MLKAILKYSSELSETIAKIVQLSSRINKQQLSAFDQNILQGILQPNNGNGNWQNVSFSTSPSPQLQSPFAASVNSGPQNINPSLATPEVKQPGRRKKRDKRGKTDGTMTMDPAGTGFSNGNHRSSLAPTDTGLLSSDTAAHGTNDWQTAQRHNSVPMTPTFHNSGWPVYTSSGIVGSDPWNQSSASLASPTTDTFRPVNGDRRNGRTSPQPQMQQVPSSPASISTGRYNGVQRAATPVVQNRPSSTHSHSDWDG